MLDPLLVPASPRFARCEALNEGMVRPGLEYSHIIKAI